ncbi:MAG: peptide-methionine (R)-S-oxide reductase MsrB [Trueperaceae bacterium]|nr:peptide-methionine (R)-S-oxide reductase MsrB [Trueperaceae bacterium]
MTTPPRDVRSGPATDATVLAPRMRRIGGVDLARALAIAGMLAVHFGPTGLSDLSGRIYALSHGRASILFVLVAGVGVSLMAASRTSGLADARLKLAFRAALLLPLGLLLQELDHRVLVILPTYGALFLVALAVLRLPDRALLTLAGVLCLLGPIVFLLGMMHAPDAFDRRAIAWSDEPARILLGVTLSGPYPVPVWAAPLLVGMWIGRRDLRAPRLRGALVLVGGGVAVLAPFVGSLVAAALGEPGAGPSWRTLTLATPHSQMPPWLLGSIGSAAFVLGLSLTIADAFARVTWPLVALGQLALTVYVGHLVVLHAASDLVRSRDVAEAARNVLVFVAVSAIAATVWRARFRRGPLEGALDVPWLVTRAVRRRLRGAVAAPAEGESHEGGQTMNDVLHLSDEEWRRRLTPEEYRVLRQHGTERAGEGCFLGTKDPGTYVCAACGNALFAAGEKFESGTGWPSFTQVLTDASVREYSDDSFGMARVEVRCARCDSHLGHVFPDGPPPTGLRYCMNSVAMRHVGEGQPIVLVDA